ncbi:extracellular solute-binding protein [Murimonas intestini]|uniref:Aldouronate transport system substrate-binding protein n=1 Tax=Murimonas intestini TaxID=1337051 RepID=A0AB73T2B6_9FIRM|nr:extracellular solute-binding protein [Murimonas intestini]MCR1842688.1 extracellular solute-binding protein [Murimonas intestini]MCR1867265.1 extracellular solute-binding protein [Murimonas intestini]MCR1884451.1 extracellular solute-binding protein [Murimonas intestini]
MKKRLAALTMALVMAGTLTACGGGSESASGGKGETSAADAASSEAAGTDAAGTDAAENDLGYEYGEDVTFHSDEPVQYTMMFSDHENYPMKDDWRIWSAIEEKANVTFKLTSVARTDYNAKVTAAVNSGSAPYIVPKIYDSKPYEDSGQIIAVSDWVQYMPNYQKQVKEWGMEEDLKQMLASDGKYYRLPGMWESVAGGYSLIIRKDVFEAAGVDMSKEAEWTWEDFYDALKKVQEHTGKDNIWSDQFQLGCAMNLAANVYGVKAGNSADGGDWGLQDGMKFDFEKNEFYFADTTEDYKEFLKYFNKLYKEGILDPETFTQDSQQAQAKFFRGDSYVLSSNYQILSDIQSQNKMQVEDADLYFMTTPSGPKGNLKVSSAAGRLENGIVITKNALDDLGEEGFIKMLRFIDWLWYSDEGHELTQWGVEGETYTKDDKGNITLNSDIYFNGFNPGASKQLNVDYGFGGGVFAYGGNVDIQLSKFTDAEKEWNERINANKVNQQLTPPVLADEMQKEDLNLIKVSLMDYVNTAALEFITGKRDIDKDWDSYVSDCESKGSTKYTDQVNEIFNDTKDILGM